MGEGLREVAEVVPGCRVEFLGVEAERRGDSEQLLHQVACLLSLADDDERGHEPERADQERSLLAGESVIGLLGPVAEDEAVLGQLLGDGQHGLVQALVVAGEEAEHAASRFDASSDRSRSAGA